MCDIKDSQKKFIQVAALKINIIYTYIYIYIYKNIFKFTQKLKKKVKSLKADFYLWDF